MLLIYEQVIALINGLSVKNITKYYGLNILFNNKPYIRFIKHFVYTQISYIHSELSCSFKKVKISQKIVFK